MNKDIEKMQNYLMEDLERLNRKDYVIEDISRSNAISNNINTYLKSINLIIRLEETKVSQSILNKEIINYEK